MQDRSFRTAWRLPALALAACAVVAALVEMRPPLWRPPRPAGRPQAVQVAVAQPVQFVPPSANPALADARRMAPPRHAPARPPEEASTPSHLATLSGRVVVSDSALGVAGAAVELTPQGRGSERRRAISAGDGSYLLASLEPGPYTVQASRRGFAPLTVVLEIEREGASRDLALIPIRSGSGSGVLSGRATDAATPEPVPFARVTGRAQRHEQVTLEPTSGTLRGTVVSRQDQAPIAGATVSLDGGWSGVTDEEGRFEIDLVSTGRRQVHAEAEGFGGVSFTLQVLGGAQDLLVDLDPLPEAECEE